MRELQEQHARTAPPRATPLGELVARAMPKAPVRDAKAGARHVPTEEEIAAEAERERIRKDSRQHGIWTSASLPKRHRTYAEANRGQYVCPRLQVVDAVREKMRLRGSIILLDGPVGVGKTQMAACLLWQLIRDETFASAWYRSLSDLVQDHINAMKLDDNITPHTRKPRVSQALLIDDLQDQPTSEFAVHLLRKTLVYRSDNLVGTTVLMTNGDEEACRTLLGPAVWSRMTETGLHAACTWKSWRARESA